MTRGFRLHLSSAIVLMLIAGAFVGVNVIPYHDGTVIIVKRDVVEESTIDLSARGWPLTFERWAKSDESYSPAFWWSSLLVNVFLALIVLTLTWTVLEWRRLPVKD